jgi:hypothetical protein
MRLLGLVAGWIAQVPTPTGPEAPPELTALVTRWLNLGWYAVLVSAFATALWGCASLAYSSKNQQFGGVNAGKKLIFWSFAGASGVSLIRVLFSWFGV